MTNDEKKNGYNELTINLDNIGLAVAKNIYWQWEFDLTKQIDLGNQYNPPIQMEIKDDSLFVDLKTLNISWAYPLDVENAGGYFNFILPYSTENRKHEIRIPTYFIDIYWLHQAYQILEDFKKIRVEYPPMKLKVGYTNIHGKKIDKNFLLNLRWDFISSPHNNDSEMAKFRIEVDEV